MDLVREDELDATASALTWWRHRPVVGTLTGTVQLLDPPRRTTGSVPHCWRLDAAVVALRGDAAGLLAATHAGTIWRLEPGHAAVIGSTGAPVHATAACGDGLVVATAREVQLVTPSGRVTSFGSPPVGVITALGVSSERSLVVGTTEGTSWLEAAIRDAWHQVEGPTVTALATHPQRRWVAAGTLDGTIELFFELGRSEESDTELFGYPERLAALEWLADGSAILGVADDELTSWTVADDGETPDEPACFHGHDRAIRALAPHPCEPIVLTVDDVGRAVVWNPALVDVPVTSTDVGGPLLRGEWSSDGSHVVVTTADRSAITLAWLPGWLA